MTLLPALLAIAALIAASVSLEAVERTNERPSAQARTAETPSARASLFAPDARKDPYRNLFQQDRRIADLPVNHRSPEKRPAGAPRIVCGMRVIPADPNVDPGIRRPTPGTIVEHTMRVLKPPMCWPDQIPNTK